MNKTVSRRQFTRALIGLAAAGCRCGERRNRGELILGTSDDRGTIDPARLVAWDWTPASQAFETLVARDHNGRLTGVLAEITDRLDPLSWRFRLQEGVRFHDGSQLKAGVVRDSLLRSSRISGSQQRIQFDEIKIEDARTMLVRTNKPFSPLLHYLAYMNFAIVHGEGTSMSGTGPFRLARYERERFAEMERNDLYWRPRPTIQRLKFRNIPDAGTRLLALQSGGIDAMRAVPLPEASRGIQSIRIFTGPGRHTHYLAFNRSAGPWIAQFNNRDFRRAMNLAIDRRALLHAVLSSMAIEAAAPVPPWWDSAVTVPAIAHDPDEARRILTAGGERIRFRYIYSPAWLPQNTAMAELIQAQLADAGVDLELILMDWGASNAAERNGRTDLRHRGLTWAVGGSYYGLRSGFHSSMSARASIHFSNDVVDRELDRWEEANSDEDMKKCSGAIQQIIASEHAFVPLYYEHEVIAIGPRIGEPGAFAQPSLDTYPVDLTAVTLDGTV
jgi:peptide/nickel transport system substrate-binding protein